MTKRSVTKRELTIQSDGSTLTTGLSATFMDADDIRRDIDEEAARYSSYPGTQHAEMATSSWVLTVLSHDGTVTIITYSDR